MTDHSDLIAELRSLADCDSRAGEPLGKCMRRAASALSSQSLSLSEARERGDAFKAAIEAAIGLFPHFRDDATQHALCVLRNALAAPALENGPADLADAASNPTSLDLSSLRKGAEDMREAVLEALKQAASGGAAGLADHELAEIADGLIAALVSGSREDGDANA